MMTNRSNRKLIPVLMCVGVVLAMLACNLPTPVPTGGATGEQTTQPATPVAAATSTPAGPAVPAHRIGVRAVGGVGEFYDKGTGEKFTPRGANYVFIPHEGEMDVLTLKVGVYSPLLVRSDFKNLAAAGYNTVRVFLDHCNKGPGCIGAENNQGLNPAYLDNIADMTAAAKEAGVFLLFTSNDLPDQGGYAEEANAQAGETFAGYRNSYYLTPGGVSATRRYWSDLLSGLVEREAAFDAVLGWQLLNEQWMFLDQPPLSLTSGTVETTTGTYDMSNPEQKKLMVSEGLIYYIAQMRAEILSHDPTALVTMGFFAPEIAAPGWYVETASLLFGAELDFFDFHAYPGGPSMEEHVNAFGMGSYQAKPIIMGEYGAFRHIYPDITSAAQAITRWQAESCRYGFDGWLYWTYHAAGPNVDDRTWGLVDEGEVLLNLLAPITYPDPCAVEAGRENLAYQKPAVASANQDGNPPANAVDENIETIWSAGTGAPQAIEVDLGGPHQIVEVRLLIAQEPAGETIHHLLGRRPNGDLINFTTFEQATQDGDWLIFTATEPIENIQVIVVQTEASPSWVAWREIQVFGSAQP